MKRKIFSILFALVLVVSFSLIAAPAALAWQEGPGTDWYYVDASYGGYHNSVPLEIKVNGDPSNGQTFVVGDTITITGYLHAVAQSFAGDGNGAYTEWHLEVNGPSGPDSDSGWNYDHGSGGAVADVDTTLTITYTLTALGIHTVYMSSYAAVSQYWTDVAEDFVDDSLTFEVVPLEVGIDIKPGSDPNSINPKSKGLIPVAILTTPSFDATTVDGTTVTFGPSSASPVHDLTDPLVVAEHQQDVDGDGDTDYVFHFRTQATGIAKPDTSATLTGQTTGGIPITGTDSIRTVGK